ncbi:MAG: glycoside hydrolase family 2 TIM barrel-domain containing protein [Bacteroidales bacterium]
MKTAKCSMFMIAFSIIMTSCYSQQNNKVENRTTSFDGDWLFIKDNPPGAETPAFEDSKWRTLDLPHDWSIEDLPGQIPDSIVGPFSKAAIGKMGTGYTIGGTAWYRKHFSISKVEQNKTAYLMFDGVYMNSDLWVNGKHVGNHPYGYTSFYYDITPYLNPAGQTNTVAVQVKNEGRTARWYSGSGIYRHTWLTLVNQIHIGVWGVNIKTQSVSANSAEINVTTTLVNYGKESRQVTVKVEIIDPSGQVAGNSERNAAVLTDTKNNIEQIVSVRKPLRWSIDNPKLYEARVTVLENKKESDCTKTSFGIRTIKVDAVNGFEINGKTVKLIGGCFHHDQGPLGAASIDRAEERKMEIFKNAGYNAIRCSHNPPSPYLLHVCDSLGILVIDEIFDNWEKEKVSPDDYSKSFKDWWKNDIESMILRDRNHPSVVMWSIGNEIREALDTSGIRIAKNLTDEVRRLDRTRPITEGFNDFAAMRGQKSMWDESHSHMEMLDVVGYNYMYKRYEEDHEKYPNRVMVATEFMPLYSLDNWNMVEKHPYVIGNFAWVVMDYLGEAGVGLSRLIPDVPVKPGSQKGDGLGAFFNRDSWPIFNDYQGDIDLVGKMKPRYYHQLVVWRKSPVEMLVHRPIPSGMKEIVSPWGWPDELKSWSWPGHEKEKLQVHVYTRSKLVKLELNGKIIGEQIVDGENSITATFEVPYEPGNLIARCYDNGKETASQSLKTAGKPASIKLTADRYLIRANRNDLAYITAEVVDAAGNVIPYADEVKVKFEISGKGKLAATGNGNPKDMASFRQPERKSYQGVCLAIVRPQTTPGKINIKATSEGLKECNLEVTVQ